MSTLVIIAKAPRPGHSKTRLTPPCTPQQAARLAAAALRETIDVVRATPVRRRVLVLEGQPGPWADGLEVLGQRGDGLDERLEHGFADVWATQGPDPGPTVLVGMDTPQVTPEQLLGALGRLVDHDAVLGPTEDGGYWAVGLARPSPGAFVGVPMSTAHTHAAQLARLGGLGLEVAGLPRLRDIDRMADADAVAEAHPHLRVARELAALRPGRAAA